MKRIVAPQVRPFSSLKQYRQEEPGVALFRWIVEQDEIPQICMGLVTLEGPIHKTPGVHDGFDQVYVIFSGMGTVHLDERSFLISEPSAVVIPAGTKHSVQLQAGEKIQYVFVNRIK